MCKHEVIRCSRCQAAFECKANAVSKCQCSQVALTLNETQFISEQFDGCLCHVCLLQLRDEYQRLLQPCLT